MAATGLSTAQVGRWQGIHDPGLLGADPHEERRRSQLPEIGIQEAFEPKAPLVLPASTGAAAAMARLIASHGHCLLVAESGLTVGLVTLADLQPATASELVRQDPLVRRECLCKELVRLSAGVRLARLEDQSGPNGLRQLPVDAVGGGRQTSALKSTPRRPVRSDGAGAGQPEWDGRSRGPANSGCFGPVGHEGLCHGIGLRKEPENTLQIEFGQLAIVAPFQRGAVQLIRGGLTAGVEHGVRFAASKDAAEN